MDRPTPDELEYALKLITDPKHLPDERTVRSNCLTARAMGLIQFAAGDTLTDAETSLRRVRAAIVAERMAQAELWPTLYTETDPFHHDDEQGTADDDAETRPARATDAARPPAAAATQADPAAPAAPEVTGPTCNCIGTVHPIGEGACVLNGWEDPPQAELARFDITTYGDAAGGRTELVDDGTVQRVGYICRRRHTHATPDYRDACNTLPGTENAG